MIIKNLNDIVRFLFCELFTICLIVKVGINIHSLSICLILPAVILIYWGMLMAPKSDHRLNDFGRICSELVIFGGTGILTYLFISKTLGIIYLVTTLINTILDHTLTSI